MKKIKKINNITNNMIIQKDTLFLDIETTGLSPAKSKLYLIGASYFENDSLVIEQFFAEKPDPDEEKQLLTAFGKLFKIFPTIITFHGNQFDLPFIQKCQNRLGIHTPFPTSPCTKNTDHCSKMSGQPKSVDNNKNYVDLYQHFLAYKHIFSLENYKLKSFEKFLGIERKDDYSGGELIKVYKEYIKNPTDESLHLLLQHNYEDVSGMVHLISLYAFDSFFEGQFIPEKSVLSAYRKMDGTDGWELTISCLLQNKLPAAISCNNRHYYLHADQYRASFRIPLFQGELKYFYPNYKDYYYLPDEDLSIHKSVAAYVDKAHRQKAKAANCYNKKTGIFLPQYEEVVTPVFYEEYKAQISYFELPEYFSSISADSSATEINLLKNYCMHILYILKSGKQ